MSGSVIAWALGRTKLPQWALELIVIAAIAGGIWYWHHHTFESGVAAEVARVERQAVKETAALQAKATIAEHQHADEIADLQAYRTAHPEQPVRLCLSTPVRPAGADQQRATASRPAAGNVQPVPAGDPGLRPGRAGPDISGLLELLAGRGDQITSQLREEQGRR